jgi:DNA repair ATPase RecN
MAKKNFLNKVVMKNYMIAVLILSLYGMIISNSHAVSSEAAQIEKLVSQLKHDLNEYAKFKDLPESYENKGKMIQASQNIIESAEKIKKMYEESSPRDSEIKQTIQRLEHLINIHKKNLEKYSF